ncbi:unnamed protein product [Nezara viridula]|uniref:Uncharacterized protein n=1 Tax=Nezara viridula TaxID=85310 RepID=A0A9P0HGT0_NEZVI|nr:unnamed protein product [Nezara viridula]
MYSCKFLLFHHNLLTDKVDGRLHDFPAVRTNADGLLRTSAFATQHRRGVKKLLLIFWRPLVFGERAPPALEEVSQSRSVRASCKHASPNVTENETHRAIGSRSQNRATAAADSIALSTFSMESGWRLSVSFDTTHSLASTRVLVDGFDSTAYCRISLILNLSPGALLPFQRRISTAKFFKPTPRSALVKDIFST